MGSMRNINARDNYFGIFINSFWNDYAVSIKEKLKFFQERKNFLKRDNLLIHILKLNK